MVSLLEQQLAQRKRSLRSTAIANDLSSPKLTGFISEDECRNIVQDQMNYNFECWYEPLQDITFKTDFLPLTREDVQLIHDVAHQYVEDKETSDQPLTKLAPLAAKLDKVLKSSFPTGAFVKGSCRSPKDAPVAVGVREKLKSRYLALLAHAGPDHQDFNTKVMCIFESAYTLLKSTTGAEALQLFGKSERVLRDYSAALEHMEQWNEHLILREWVDMDVDMEFRGFVHQGRLTAISQYNHLGFSQRLVDDQDKLLRTLCQFYDTMVKPRLGDVQTPSFIVDFAISDYGKDENGNGEETRKQREWVVELNPWMDTTDSALFDWKEDLWLLEGRERNAGDEVADAGAEKSDSAKERHVSSALDGVVFRVRSKAKDTKPSSISHEWRQVMEEAEKEALTASASSTR